MSIRPAARAAVCTTAAAVTLLLAGIAALAGAPAADAHGSANLIAFVQSGVLKAYDPEDGHITVVARGAAGDVAVSPDAKRIAWIARDGSLHVIGADGKGDRRIAKGPLRSPLWRSADELGAVRPALGLAVDAVAFTIKDGKERSIAKGVASQVFPFGADLVAKPAPGCATNDLYLGGKQLAKTPLDSEVPLDTGADIGIVAVARTQKSSFQCAPDDVPVPTALRVFETTGKSRVVVRLGTIPANRPADAALSPAGTELAYVTPRGDLAVRAFLTRKDRIVARGGVSAVDW